MPILTALLTILIVVGVRLTLEQSSYFRTLLLGSGVVGAGLGSVPAGLL